MKNARIFLKQDSRTEAAFNAAGADPLRCRLGYISVGCDPMTGGGPHMPRAAAASFLLSGFSFRFPFGFSVESAVPSAVNFPENFSRFLFRQGSV